MKNQDLTILVVEDDPRVGKLIECALGLEGYRVLRSTTGNHGLSVLLSEQVDLMLVDMGLPDMDGAQLITKVREWAELPIIVVSARDQDKEKALALDLGADDYLTKPFSTTELMARIRVAFRHLARQKITQAESVYEITGLKVDVEKHLTYVEGEEVHLTPMEFTLLVCLFKNIGKVLTTSFIIKEVWGPGYGEDTQALRTLVASLRRKIEKDPALPQYLITEIGVGYRLLER